MLHIHLLSLRLFLMPVTPAHCWTFPTTTATAFMYHGCRRVYAVQDRFMTLSVGSSLRIMPFYADTSLAHTYALRSASLTDSTSSWSASSTSAMDSHLRNCTPPGFPLRIITRTGSPPSTDQHEPSMEAGGTGAQNPLESSFTADPSLTLCESPVSGVGVICDGWCRSDPIPRPTVVRTICAL
jgi:hypothetical protein